MSSHLLAAFRESPELYRRKTNGEIAEGESPALAAQPSTAPGWRFMATPDAQQAGTRWFWKDGQFTTEPPAQPDWQGVWYYPDTNP